MRLQLMVEAARRDDPPSSRKQAGKKQARVRILRPVAGKLRLASLLSVASGLLWPIQAAALATAISAWIDGTTPVAATVPMALVFVFAGLVKATFDHLCGRLLFDAADTIIAEQRTRLIRREARAPTSASSAAIAALIVQKLPILQPWITRYRLAMARASVLPLVLLLCALWNSWAVAIILFVAGPLIPVFMALVGMAADEASRRQMSEISSMNAMLMERLSALVDIRVLGARDRAVEDFAQRAEALRAATMKVLAVAFLSSTVLELFAALGVAMVAVYVGFSLLGEITFGAWGTPLTLWQGLFVLLLAPDFFQPLRDMAAAWHDRAAGQAVIDELENLERAERIGFVGTGGRESPLDGTLSVTLHDSVVDLPGKRVALPDLELRAGEAVAIAGPSGAGKSTTLLAIAGLVRLTSGTIEVCGQPLDDQTADAWRRRVSFLPQTPHFADQSLAAYLDPAEQGGSPDRALSLAHASDVVARLGNGLETRLGEVGAGVSGGEARRLMLARAIHADADLLLADEPTADLDAETAAMVIDTLLALRTSGWTLLVATHDPNLMSAMDRTVEVR
jgi:ATP-binding cassette subfamily C protein CydD